MEDKKGLHVLFGISGVEEDDIKKFVSQLSDYGLNIEKYGSRYKKLGISAYLKQNADTDVVIVAQYLEERSPYSGSDFESLVEHFEDVTIIPILRDDAVGSSIVHSLFQLGVFTGVFDADASFEMIAKLISGGRTRRDAKEYYNIQSNFEDRNQLDYNSTAQFLEESPDNELESRVLHILKLLKPNEFVIILGMISDACEKKIMELDCPELEMYGTREKKSGFLSTVGKKKIQKSKSESKAKLIDKEQRRKRPVPEKKEDNTSKLSDIVGKMSVGVFIAIVLVVLFIVFFVFGNFIFKSQKTTTTNPQVSSTPEQVQETMEPEVTATPDMKPTPEPTQSPTAVPQTEKPKATKKREKPKQTAVVKERKSNQNKESSTRKQTEKKQKNEDIKPDNNEVIDGL